MEFGTDGIRGVFGIDVTVELAQKLANALRSLGTKRIVVGRDTRPSGIDLEQAVVKGATDAGIDVTLAGVVTTPMLALLSKKYGFDYGVMLTASHNPKEYNGLKIIDSRGRKPDRVCEKKLEEAIERTYLSSGGGSVMIEDYSADYLDALRVGGAPLENLKVICDSANGAVTKYAERLFDLLGARVIEISDGGDINDECGALYPAKCRNAVLRTGADIGFAFDGDGDRMIAVLSDGRILDGDCILLAMVRYALHTGERVDAVCGTVNSNSALEKALTEMGVGLLRTDVGDHNVTAKLIEEGLRLGSEQSGHIIDRRYLDTGDGLWAAVSLTRILMVMGAEAFDYAPTPQSDHDIPCDNKRELYEELKRLGADELLRGLPGIEKVVLRPSGTEPKVRATFEGEERSMSVAISVLDSIATLLQQKNCRGV